MRPGLRKSTQTTEGGNSGNHAEVISSFPFLSLPAVSKKIRHRYTVNKNHVACDEIARTIIQSGIPWKRRKSLIESIEASLDGWVHGIVGERFDGVYSLMATDREALEVNSDFVAEDKASCYLLFQLGDCICYDVGGYLQYVAREYGKDHARHILNLCDDLPVWAMTPKEALCQISEYYWQGAPDERGSDWYDSDPETYEGFRLRDWKAAYPEWAYDEQFPKRPVNYRYHFPAPLSKYIEKLEKLLDACTDLGVYQAKMYMDYPMAGFVVRWRDGDPISQLMDDQYQDFFQCGQIFLSYYLVPVSTNSFSCIRVLLLTVMAFVDLMEYCDRELRKERTRIKCR